MNAPNTLTCLSLPFPSQSQSVHPTQPGAYKDKPNQNTKFLLQERKDPLDSSQPSARLPIHPPQSMMHPFSFLVESLFVRELGRTSSYD